MVGDGQSDRSTLVFVLSFQQSAQLESPEFGRHLPLSASDSYHCMSWSLSTH